MSRLPQPGSDNGTWGTILNDFLSQAHNTDGTLKSGVVTGAQVANGSLSSTKLDTTTQANLSKASTAVQSVNGKKPSSTGAITLTTADIGAPTKLGNLTDVSSTTPSNGQVLTYSASTATWSAATPSASAGTTTPDATTTSKGVVQLAGDLGGSSTTAAAPKLAATTNVNTIISANTTVAGAAQKSANLSDLASAATARTNLGLGNVDNTSDVNKPISSATQTALNAKAPSASPTFTGTVTVPTPVNNTDAATKSYVDTTASAGTPDANATTKGKLQLTGDLGGTAASPTVPGLATKAPLASPTFTGTVTVPSPVNTTDAATKAYVDASATADATTSTKGKVQLAGDLAGTAASPSVAKVNGVSVSGTPPSAGQVLTASGSTAASWSTPASAPVTSVAGKTGAVTLATTDLTDVSVSSPANNQILTYNSTTSKWVNQAAPSAPVSSVNSQTGAVVLAKSDVGLGNVDNTSDATKNSATAVLTNKTISGASNTLTNIPESAVTNLTTDLAAKAPTASPTFTGTVTVPTPVNNTDAATKSYVDTTASAGTPDANATTKGKVQLAGDLSGTAASPSVAKVNGIAVSGTPTTGQVLTATSGTAASWSTPVAGFSDPTTTKGDLIVHGSTTTRQAVGTDGQVLTADSTQSTGVKWATPATAPVTSVAGKTGAVTLAESDITNLTTDLAAKAPTASPTFTGTVTVPTPVNTTDAATKSYVDTTAAAGTPDATTSAKGKIQLAGDLAGTAASPSVAKVNGIAVSGTPTNGQVLTATSGTAASWSTPTTAPVTSVAGKTGAVTLAESDITNLVSDLAGKQPVPTGTTDGTKFLRDDNTWQGIPTGSSIVFKVSVAANATASTVMTALNSAITSANNAVSAGAGTATVLIPQGTYKVNSQTTNPATGVTIQGEGAGTIIRVDSGWDGSPYIFNLTDRGITIRDMRIDGGPNQSRTTAVNNPTLTAAIRIDACLRAKVENMDFRFIQGWCIEAIGSSTGLQYLDIAHITGEYNSSGIHLKGNTNSSYAIQGILSSINLQMIGTPSGGSDILWIEDGNDVQLWGMNACVIGNASTNHCIRVTGHCASIMLDNIDVGSYPTVPSIAPIVLLEANTNGDTPKNVNITGGIIQSGDSLVRVDAGDLELAGVQLSRSGSDTLYLNTNAGDIRVHDCTFKAGNGLNNASGTPAYEITCVSTNKMTFYNNSFESVQGTTSGTVNNVFSIVSSNWIDFRNNDFSRASGFSYTSSTTGYRASGTQWPKTVRQNRSLNPSGTSSSTPSVPASGSASSGQPWDAYVRVVGASGGSCTIALTGLTGSPTLTWTVGAGTTFDIPFIVPAGCTLTPTYTTGNAPTWTYYGM